LNAACDKAHLNLHPQRNTIAYLINPDGIARSISTQFNVIGWFLVRGPVMVTSESVKLFGCFKITYDEALWVFMTGMYIMGNVE